MPARPATACWSAAARGRRPRLDGIERPFDPADRRKAARARTGRRPGHDPVRHRRRRRRARPAAARWCTSRSSAPRPTPRSASGCSPRPTRSPRRSPLHRPDVVAVERVFSQHNVRTVMGTAQVAGLAIVAATRAGMPVALHTPERGEGGRHRLRARPTRRRCGAMVTRLLRLTEAPRPADAADALALAICHVWRGAPRPGWRPRYGGRRGSGHDCSGAARTRRSTPRRCTRPTPIRPPPAPWRRELRTEVRDAPDEIGELVARGDLVDVLRILGELDDALREARARSTAPRSPATRAQQHTARLRLAQVHLTRGEFAESTLIFTELLAVADPFGPVIEAFTHQHAGLERLRPGALGRRPRPLRPGAGDPRRARAARRRAGRVRAARDAASARAAAQGPAGPDRGGA